ncbi:hypothetical protein MWH25_03100 [Natroniella acetigena]|uniref:hypothetical protein n=1 Tax=Natroniella acetigena TaxID=52004 RepID=UPI00200A029D|nr:hypothetical protein [Natroniella acetigena]MCK8826731.1 hypothetical protein [Natroniella acetigena]
MIEAIVFLEAVLDNFLSVELKESKKLIHNDYFSKEESLDFQKVTESIIKNGKRLKNLLQSLLEEVQSCLEQI